MRQNPSTPTPEKEINSLISSQNESTDDKIIAKQQALTAGITGKRAKSPNQQSQQTQQSCNKQDGNHTSNNVSSQKIQVIRKDESRSKRTRSGSRRGRDNRELRYRGSGSNVSKQTSSDLGNEDWETTSENSEDHTEDHKESRNSRNKQFSARSNTGNNQNVVASNMHSRRNEQAGNNREKNVKSSNTASRAPGAEKRNLQNSSFANQKNHSNNIPPLIQTTQIQNGRSRNQTSGNSLSISNKSITKDTTVNRLDEIKLSDSNLVSQALNDINKRSQGKEKKPMIDCEM